MLVLENLAELVGKYSEDLKSEVASFKIRQQSFDASKTQMMGVVNLSADSWYRESVCLSIDQAIQRGKRLAIEGALIIDVGAESTILNAERVSSEAQSSQLVPVIQELNEAGILVSVETYHDAVTKACLNSGAAVLNLTSSVGDESLFKTLSDYEAGVIICYVQGEHVRSVNDFILSDDHTDVLYDYFAKQIELATKCGVERIWIDPGLGFYYANLQDGKKRIQYQMKTFLETFRLRKLGWPVCHALPHAFDFFGEEVRTAESFFAVLALLGKTNLLRTHEVAKVKAVLESMECY
ncbi:MAG: dihydropteroate synthase [Verrucomicrobiota bacterium]